MYDLALLETWNVAVFGLLRSPADASAFLVQAGVWLAELPAYAAALLMLCYIARNRDGRGAFALAVALIAAWFVKAAIGVHAYHARPFAAGFGPALIEHASSHSMPSSHVTFVWILAVVCATRGQWRLTSILFLLGCVLAWARVFVGVHWPLDMLGAAVAAVACGLFGSGVQYLCAGLYSKARFGRRRSFTAQS